MAITQDQIDEASTLQETAAHDPRQRARLVAPPGTGKSFAIEERTSWLLSQGVSPHSICVCSFTRAAARDLRRRVHSYCEARGRGGAADVRVTTLHSLALRTLRAAGMLGAYPAEPLVLDEWELANIFDAEFGTERSIATKRRREIRRDYEAFWSTGQWVPPNHIPPDPPITNEERRVFEGFHGERTQVYSCVLPGELVRQCTDAMEAGTLDPVQLLGIGHLIVDEYQDLNPVDQHFVELLHQMGATVFVAGDDDQSIYAFRFASPAGLQRFVDGHADAGSHFLEGCFRCTPAVLGAGVAVIHAHPLPGRIAKQCTSLYEDSTPPVSGVVHRWRFAGGAAEAASIATSCGRLIDAGVDPRQILVLLSNPRVQGRDLLDQFEIAGVPYEYCREERVRDSDAGRLALALLRVVSNPEDYIAHRTILGLRRQVGVATCNAVCRTVTTQNLNFRDCFYQDQLPDVFPGRARAALEGARAVCAETAGWKRDDTYNQRAERLGDILQDALGDEAVGPWEEFVAPLPEGITLAEVRDLLCVETDDQRSAILESVMERLGLPIPEEGPLPAKVRIMTMHGAKGLSARVVFIPGLEEDLLPGPWRRPYTGLVLEAARLLYVSITRARAACVVSYATRRLVHGTVRQQTPSRFAHHLGGPFAGRHAGLSEQETARIAEFCAEL